MPTSPHGCLGGMQDLRSAVEVKSRTKKGPACHVEGVEGHLRGRLAHALGGQNTDCFSGGSQALQELEVHELREALGAPRQQLWRLLPDLLLSLQRMTHQIWP